jgi:hypothetical protein
MIGATGVMGDMGDTGEGRSLVNRVSSDAVLGFGTASTLVALASAAMDALVGPASGYLEYGGSCSVCPSSPMMSCSSPSRLRHGDRLIVFDHVLRVHAIGMGRPL